MDFDELQKNWQSQPVHIPDNAAAVNDKLISRWQKQQRGVLWSNIATTGGFIGVFIVFAWVYISFHAGRSIFFGSSLLFMYMLLLVYLWVIWKGIAYKKNDPTLASKAYIEHSIEKLYWRRKTITTFSWVYSVLLWIALMFYLIDMTQEGTLLFKLIAFGATSGYIFGMQLLMKYTKQKKQLKKIDELIADMKQTKEKIVE